MWCVRRRTERRSRGGCFFCHSAHEYRPNRRPSEGNLGCAPRDFANSWPSWLRFSRRVEEKSGVSNPRVDIPRASRRRRDARVWRRTRNHASDFSGRKKITRRCSCDYRSIRRRVASYESGRALPTRVERTRAREHVARASERGAGRHAFARPRRAREATLDSVSG